MLCSFRILMIDIFSFTGTELHRLHKSQSRWYTLYIMSNARNWLTCLASDVAFPFFASFLQPSTAPHPAPLPLFLFFLSAFSSDRLRHSPQWMKVVWKSLAFAFYQPPIVRCNFNSNLVSRGCFKNTRSDYFDQVILVVLVMKLFTQSVHIRPWKTFSQHNIASGRNMKKSKYYVWIKYFDWKQNLLGSNISSRHNLHIVPWRNIAPWRNIFHGRKWSDCVVPNHS